MAAWAGTQACSGTHSLAPGSRHSLKPVGRTTSDGAPAKIPVDGEGWASALLEENPDVKRGNGVPHMLPSLQILYLMSPSIPSPTNMPPYSPRPNIHIWPGNQLGLREARELAWGHKQLELRPKLKVWIPQSYACIAVPTTCPRRKGRGAISKSKSFPGGPAFT